MALPPEIAAAEKLRFSQDYPGALQRVNTYVGKAGKNELSESAFGLIYRDMGDLARSESHLAEALRLRPGYPRHKWNIGVNELHKGNWLRGWALYEERSKLVTWRYSKTGVPFAKRNQILNGRRVLIFQEQGAGDFFQFVRFVPRLVATGARVHVQCDENIAPVISQLQESLGIESVIDGPRPNGGLPSFDFQIPIMSLPFVMNCMAPIADVPYISAPAAAVEEFQDVRNSARPIVMAWRTNSDSENSPARSCPLSIFRQISQDAGFQLFSVQYKPTVGERTEMNDQGITDLSPRLTNFGRTAAAIAAAGRVITIDTSVAHLAGALNASTVLLLHSAADWRWHDDQVTSRWYPSLRIVRQANPRDWSSCIPRAREVLAGL